MGKVGLLMGYKLFLFWSNMPYHCNPLMVCFHTVRGPNLRAISHKKTISLTL